MMIRFILTFGMSIISLFSSTVRAEPPSYESPATSGEICYGLMMPAGVTFKSPAMKQLIERDLSRVAPRDMTVLILGPSGSGKEVVAKIIHANSRRKSKPFLAYNMAGLDPNIATADLFGASKSAFTGNTHDRKGYFESADGGTIFLDEIGDASLEIQAKLLRLLQEQEVVRLGETQARKVNVRIIAATNKNLEALVREGKFREDLFHRLWAYPIEIPRLALRKEDIAPIAQMQLDIYKRKEDLDIRGFSPDALKKLENYDYPGNVRELIHVVERAALFADAGGFIEADHIDFRSPMQFFRGYDASICVAQSCETPARPVPTKASNSGESDNSRELSVDYQWPAGLTTNLDQLKRAAVLQVIGVAPLATIGAKPGQTNLTWAEARLGIGSIHHLIHHSKFKEFYLPFLQRTEIFKKEKARSPTPEELQILFSEDTEYREDLSLQIVSHNIDELFLAAIKRVFMTMPMDNLVLNRSRLAANPLGVNLEGVAKQLGYSNSRTFMNFLAKQNISLDQLMKLRLERDQANQ